MEVGGKEESSDLMGLGENESSDWFDLWSSSCEEILVKLRRTAL